MARASNTLTNPLKQLTVNVRDFQQSLALVDQLVFESGNGSLVFEDVGIPLQGCARMDDLMRDTLKDIRDTRDEKYGIAALSDFASRVYFAARLLEVK